MIGVIPFKGSSPVPVDPDWLDLWSNGFPDTRLCNSMLAEERLSTRIGEVMLKRMEVRGEAAMRPGGQIGMQLKTYLALPRDPFTELLGMLWKSPVLSPILPSPRARQENGLKSRAILDVVIAYRDHEGADDVAPLGKEQNFKAEGTLCLYAWIAQFEASLQDRLFLTLPFQAGDIGAHAARCALTVRVLSDETALGALGR